jgi:DNA/RNA endonuclease G (NUC1)
VLVPDTGLGPEYRLCSSVSGRARALLIAVDIFVSYTHVDRERVRPLVELLETEGWTVWWDRGIVPGEPWLPELEAEIGKARAMVVVWSRTSVKSQWVRHEAGRGLEQDALVPVMFDVKAPPAEFSHIQAIDLSRWDGNKQITEIEALLRRLASLALPSRIDTVRPGYDPLFLGSKRQVKLPGVSGPVAVLRYLHFTVVMNPARRIAHYVAYNSDGERLASVPRPRKDPWSADPLLPESLQMNIALLRHSPYDRGQLVARTAVCWGEPQMASIANRQAFYWPNVAPQHRLLNRHIWLQVEKWEHQQARDKGPLTGFSGPVFSANDEPRSGEVKFEHGLVARDTFRVPLAYWKVCVASAARGPLAVAAFLVSQAAFMETTLPVPEGVSSAPDPPPEAGTALAPFRVRLEYLERLAQLRFPEKLHTAVPL